PARGRARRSARPRPSLCRHARPLGGGAGLAVRLPRRTRARAHRAHRAAGHDGRRRRREHRLPYPHARTRGGGLRAGPCGRTRPSHLPPARPPRRPAASPHAGPVTLYLAAANRGDHRLYAADEPRDSVTVATIVLDAVLATESRVDFIKMDVQGAEVAVLRGLGATLESHPDVRILSELSPEMLERAGVDAEDFFAPLRARG